jgi:DNA-binding XRE family transcriptional regulator
MIPLCASDAFAWYGHKHEGFALWSSLVNPRCGAVDEASQECELRKNANVRVPVKQAKKKTPQRYRTVNSSAVVAAECARRLLELRDHTGETQRSLARRLGMTESMISRLERGDHVPSLATLCRIANAFGRRLEIVFHEHEHEHADGTRHSHPHSHFDPDHRHKHGGKE